MKRAKKLEHGKRYFDTDTKAHYRVLELLGFDEVKVQFDNYKKPEIFSYADLLRDSFQTEPEGIEVSIKKLHPLAVTPEYKTEDAAGFDFYIIEGVTIPPNRIQQDYFGDPSDRDDRSDFSKYVLTLTNDNHAILRTGLSFEIPIGYELEIRGRSGLAFKCRVISFNGTIDSDYRGEVMLLITNLGNQAIKFEIGDRVAQGIIKKIDQARFSLKEELSVTSRGTGGLGHTGK